ncbi:MAG: ABC transporter ATP-binding protein [Acidimicrobiales bacterium]|jgi:ABC-type multidrug transport system fused ATPase/permease subunit
MLASLKVLGVRSLHRRLAWLAACSFFSGLAQASLLVIISEFAVNSAKGKNHLEVHGYSLSIPDAVFFSATLLIIYSLASIAAALSSSSLASTALASARNKMIDAFFGASWTVQSQERLGHVQQLLTVNCETVGQIALAIAAGLQAVLTVVALLAAAFLVSPIAATVVLVFGILLQSALRPFNTWGRKASVHLSEDSHTMATLVTEYTRLTGEFRLFGVEHDATAELHRSNEIAARTFRRLRIVSQLSGVTYQVLALAFIVCAFAVVAGHTGSNLGSIAAVLLLMLRSMTYGATVQSTSQQLRSYSGFLDKVKCELDRFLESRHESGTGELPASFDINVKNVSFAYDDRGPVLRQVSFCLPGGHILGIAGRSGSGKTTLSQILLGMRHPTDGAALVGDVSVERIAKGGGASPVALVAQDPVLLQGSIAFNISFFRGLLPEEIEAASRAAHLHEDVTAMPDLYETSVGEGGTALSGGQRQRLAIARALAGAPRVLILDEPTSALDGRSESLIRQTLNELRGRVTIVVISHRLGLVEDCDLLLVLDEGRVADFGPGSEVLARDAFRQVAEAVTSDVIDEPLREG